MKHKLLRFGIFLLFVVVSARFYLMSDWNSMFDNERFVLLKRCITWSSRNPETDKLAALYLKTHKIESPIWFRVFRESGLPVQSCPSLEAVFQIHPYSSYPGRFKGAFAEYLFAKKIESIYSDQDIVKFVFNRSFYLYDNVGPQKAAIFWFKKNLAELNEKELLTLVIMQKNPSLYNPYRRQELIDATVARYQHFLHPKRN